MIIVLVIVLGYHCRTKNTYNPYTCTLARFPVLLDVHVNVMTSVIVRVEDTVRVHIQICFLYIYIYIYISLSPSL